MNKKIGLTLVAFAILVVSILCIKHFTAKEVQEGNKTVSINIVSVPDNINKTEKLNTNEDILGNALSKERFKVVDGMVLKIDEIDLSNSDSVYWSITLNGERAKVGVNSMNIKDGDIIKFERVSFK